jgi:hypothetical protein
MFQFTGFATGGGGGGFGLGSGIATGAIVSPALPSLMKLTVLPSNGLVSVWIRFFAVNSGNEYAGGNGGSSLDRGDVKSSWMIWNANFAIWNNDVLLELVGMLVQPSG